jgi:hypothetical protein
MAAIEKLNTLLDMTASKILMKRAVGKFFGRLSLLSLRKSFSVSMPLAVPMLVYINLVSAAKQKAFSGM